jgi:hypothetical protein
MTLASTLLATGIPVAADTYRKTVNSANAQIALSTTITVLRSELGFSTDVRVAGSGSETKIYYLSGEGYWASIGNAKVQEDGTTYRGLVKEYYKGRPYTDSGQSVEGLGDSMGVYPLVSDSAISEPLHVSFQGASRADADGILTIEGLSVTDKAATPLAGTNNYSILLRFAG